MFKFVSLSFILAFILIKFLILHEFSIILIFSFASTSLGFKNILKCIPVSHAFNMYLEKKKRSLTVFVYFVVWLLCAEPNFSYFYTYLKKCIHKNMYQNLLILSNIPQNPNDVPWNITIISYKINAHSNFEFLHLLGLINSKKIHTK